MKKDDKKKRHGKHSGDMVDLSPASIQRHLKGVDYPATKQDLIDHAKKQGAGEEVMAFLNSLPDERFKSPIGVMKNFREAKGKAAS